MTPCVSITDEGCSGLKVPSRNYMMHMSYDNGDACASTVWIPNRALAYLRAKVGLKDSKYQICDAGNTVSGRTYLTGFLRHCVTQKYTSRVCHFGPLHLILMLLIII